MFQSAGADSLAPGDGSDIAGTGLGIGARHDTERLRRRRVRGAAVRRHLARKSRDGKRTSLFARALAGGDVVSFDPVSSTVSCLGPSPCHSARKLPRKPALQRRPSRIRAESGRRAVSTASKMSQDGLSAARGFRPSHSAQSYGLLVCFHSAGRVALISATVVPSLDPSAGAVLQ